MNCSCNHGCSCEERSERSRPPSRSPNRRAFLKRAVMAGGAMTAGLSVFEKLSILFADEPADAMMNHLGPHDPAVRKGVPGRKWVMVIDLAKCDGCGKCVDACSKMHFVPQDRQWIKVLRLQDSKNTAPYYFPQTCYQCDNPPCTKVCPVDATFKRDDGVVLIDNLRCIGCRYCIAACPYNARSFNWGHPENPAEAMMHSYSPETGFPRSVGTVEKCDFCPHLAERGELPPCTSQCPMGAIWYGDQNEDAVTNSKGETARFTKLIEENAGYRHLEELGTKPRVYYLPPKTRMYPAPPAEKNPYE